jgi:hypothetical protein
LTRQMLGDAEWAALKDKLQAIGWIWKHGDERFSLSEEAVIRIPKRDGDFSPAPVGGVDQTLSSGFIVPVLVGGWMRPFSS